MTKYWDRKIQIAMPENLIALMGVMLVVLSACSSTDPAKRFEGVYEDLPEGTFQLTEQQSRLTDAEVLKKFQAPEEEVYHYGRGDEITIEVWDHPELSGKHVIGPDGFISLPIVGQLKMAELTRHDGGKLVAKSVSQYYPGVPTTIRVDRYTSNRVQILGRVSKPGIISFDTPPTLLEAISLAGGLPVGGIGSDKAALTRCAVFRGKDRVVWIDLRAILTGRDISLNIRLQRNDLVYIPDADDQLVYVMGSVHTPGAYRLTPGMSLLDALATAGGPNVDANLDQIQIVRPSIGFSKEFSMESILAPEPQLNIALEEGDILYIPESGVAKAGYVLKAFAPLTQIMVFGALAAGLAF
ncbi:MAG: SLBB domain-containing protein [Nitrospirota bacterium]|nr:MAG: SLBB domain-containing protein [Nitrospirota bacterium]